MWLGIHDEPSSNPPSQVFISSALTSITAERGHLQCHLLIIKRSQRFVTQHSVIFARKRQELIQYLIDHIAQYPSNLCKTTKTWDNTCNIPCLHHPLHFSRFVPWVPVSIEGIPQPQELKINIQAEGMRGRCRLNHFHCTGSLSRLLKARGKGRLIQNDQNTAVRRVLCDDQFIQARGQGRQG